jgi:hypothetical protein
LEGWKNAFLSLLPAGLFWVGHFDFTKKKRRRGWKGGSSSRVLAYQTQSPEFKPQYSMKKKKRH